MPIVDTTYAISPCYMLTPAAAIDYSPLRQRRRHERAPPYYFMRARPYYGYRYAITQPPYFMLSRFLSPLLFLP